jgi:hypothetical protein
MDIIIGALSAALVIGLSSLVGRSLDRAKSRALREGGLGHGDADADADADAALYGDF